MLAVGLWLRFDPETVELLAGDEAPDTFFIGRCTDKSPSRHPLITAPTEDGVSRQLQKSQNTKEQNVSSVTPWAKINWCENTLQSHSVIWCMTFLLVVKY